MAVFSLSEPPGEFGLPSSQLAIVSCGMTCRERARPNDCVARCRPCVDQASEALVLPPFYAITKTHLRMPSSHMFRPNSCLDRRYSRDHLKPFVPSRHSRRLSDNGASCLPLRWVLAPLLAVPCAPTQWYGVHTSLNMRSRILNGACPSDRSVGFPTKFELTLNLKTARGLSLIPLTICHCRSSHRMAGCEPAPGTFLPCPSNWVSASDSTATFAAGKALPAPSRHRSLATAIRVLCYCQRARTGK
jgi:hypothetical protein